MKPVALGLAAIFLAGAAMAQEGGSQSARPNVLTAQEKAAGWKLLFDGRTTDGWREFKKTGIGPGWRVVDGVLSLVDPKQASDIITTDKYADFELIFDWRISKNGNSGVYYHVIEAGAHGYETGPEYQLLDNGHGEPPLEQAASAFGLYAPSKDVTRPVGEFNHSRLVVLHDHVEHWLNGVKVTEYQIGSADFKARVAATKFHNWPLFATAPTGYIALQDHGDVVAFRNIKIRPLD
jgi:hypothetical protein